MKKLPYGISNYEQLITENYYYVDKTKYIEQLENIAERNIMFLRPRKFGKTLFTSTLEYYYDINSKEKFEKLFGETYIGKNPSNLRNSYYILRFNFSGIDTSNEENAIAGFKEKVVLGIERFVNKYKIDFYINKDQSSEAMLGSIFEAFKMQKENGKIYVIIDEYDHFANELLGFLPENFNSLVSRNGKVRKWYEVLKEASESAVDRIFITGVAPITLDSLTSGFNIGKDLTRDGRFNEMLGFTKEELIKIFDEQGISKEQQEKILPVMKENYDGYRFSLKGKEKIYNSNMCLYFLNEYLVYNDLPERLIDVNIASDYSKLEKMLNLCQGENKKQILEKTLTDEGITARIIERFNPKIGFTEQDFVSMLFYLGYLTIADEMLNSAVLKIPNNVMRELYAEFFIKIIEEETNLTIKLDDYNKMLEEVALHGKIDKLVELTHKYLNSLSNRDYEKFDEKYVKLIFFCIAMNMSIYSVKSEPEYQRKYPDIMMIPQDTSKGYQAVIIEFKYLKAGEKAMLEEKQKEAKEQIQKYAELEEIKKIQNMNKYTIVAVNDELYVEKID